MKGCGDRNEKDMNEGRKEGIRSGKETGERGRDEETEMEIRKNTTKKE